jgi:deoxyinosine 3'endonuclease (endonuclease V)
MNKTSIKKKSHYNDILNSVDPALIKQWETEQTQIKAKFDGANKVPTEVDFVAGCDITFSQNHPNIAISTVAILDKNFEIVVLKNKVGKVDVPYVPGFLAFREVPQLTGLFQLAINDLGQLNPGHKIACIFVDGNGILHPKECGLATHLGVLLGIPTIGCAKTIFAIDGINSTLINHIKEKFKNEHKGEKGVRVPLKGNSSKIWGMALKNSEGAYDPSIISVGTMVDIDTATDLVIRFSKNRVVEPVRVCDKHSRFLIKEFDAYHKQGVKEGQQEDEILEAFQQSIDSKPFQFFKKFSE